MKHDMKFDPIVQAAEKFMKESGYQELWQRNATETLPLKTRILYRAMSEAVQTISQVGLEIEGLQANLSDRRDKWQKARLDLEEALALAKRL